MDQNIEIQIRAKNLTEEAFRRVSQAMRELEQGAAGVQTNTRTASQGLTTMEGAAGRALSTLTGFVGAQVLLGAGAAAYSTIKDAAIGMNSTLEKSTLQFTTLMGDSDRARAHVADLFEIAKKTPFETGPIIQASMALQVAGGAALNTKGHIIMLGDAAAATGAPIDELSRWTGRLYAALQGGKPFGEATENLRRLMVMSPQTSQKLEDMQKAGKSASEIFAVFTGDLGRFSGAMEKQAGTWEGVTSTFRDSVNLLAADAFKPLFVVVRDGIAAIDEFMSSPAAEQMAAWFKDELSGAIQTAGDAYRSFADYLKGDDSAQAFAILVKASAISIKNSAGSIVEDFRKIHKAFDASSENKGEGFGEAAFGLASGWVQQQVAAFDLLATAINYARVAIEEYKQAHTSGLFPGSPADLGQRIGRVLVGSGTLPTLPPSPIPAPMPNTGPTSPYASGMVSGVDYTQQAAGASAATAGMKAYQKAIEEAAHANDILTVTQGVEILSAKALGLSDAQVADILRLHDSTVKHYVATVQEQSKVEKENAEWILKHMADATQAVEATNRKRMEAETHRFDASMKAAAENFLVVGEFQDKLEDLQRTSTERQVVAIDRAHASELTNLKAVTNLSSAEYARRKGIIDAYYDHERRVALQTADTIEERMTRQGIYTTQALDTAAEAARRDYEAMAASGKYTADVLGGAWQKMLAAEDAASGKSRDAWMGVFSDLAPGFQALAQVSGDSFGGMLKAVGAFVAGMSQAKTVHGEVISGWQDMTRQGGDFSKGFSKVASGVATAAATMVSAFQSIGQSADTASNTINGAMAGAQAGAAVGGGWGALVGGIIGGVSGFLTNRDAAQVMDEVGTTWGAHITDALAIKIQDDMQQFPDLLNDALHREMAEVYNLGAIIQAAGGITEKNFSGMAAKLKEAFSWLKDGMYTVEQTRKVLTDAFPAFAAELATAGGLAKKEFLDIIALDKQMGTSSPAVASYLKTAASGVAEGFGQIVTAQETATAAYAAAKKALSEAIAGGKSDQSALDELQATVDKTRGAVTETQGDFDRLGRLAMDALSAGLNSGLTFNQALLGIDGSLSTMESSMGAMGFTASGVFKDLMKIETFNKAFPEVAGGIDGLNKMLLGLNNSGLLTQASFNDLGDMAAANFKKMTDGGLNSDQAFATLRGTLQTLWQLQEDGTYKADEATQALLDQAKAGGVIGEKFKPAMDQLVTSLNKFIDRFDVFLDRLGGISPKVTALNAALAGGAAVPGIGNGGGIDNGGPATGGRGQDKADESGMPGRRSEGGNYPTTPTAPTPRGPEFDIGVRDTSSTTIGHYALGGIVPQYFGVGGSPFVPRGTDTVPAMLTPGEGVLSRRGMDALGRLNAGQASGGDAASVAELKALRGDMQSMLASLPRMMRDAVLLAH